MRLPVIFLVAALASVSMLASASILDVDNNGQVDVATDIIYVARRLLGLAPVPASFRRADPTIPSDATIAANVDAAVAETGTSLKVLDAKGNSVGTVGNAKASGATVFLSVGGDLFALDVDTNGFKVNSTGYYGTLAPINAENFLYATSDCSGTRYSGGYYGVQTPSPSNFALSALIPPPDTGQPLTAYFGRPAEMTTQQYYSLTEQPSDSSHDAPTNCTTGSRTCPNPGVVIGTTHPCATDSGFPSGATCVACCRPDAMPDKTGTCMLFPTEQEAPVHTFSVDDLGFTPPFRLQP